MSTTATPPKTDGGKTNGLLEQTLSTYLQYCEEFSRGAVACSEDPESKTLIKSTADRFVESNKRLFEYIRSNHARLSLNQQKSIEEYLVVQDAVALGVTGADTMKVGFKAGWVKKFLKWMLKWFKELKKVLREILEMITDALGISLPRWLNTIFLLLDELYDAIVELISGVFGLDTRQIAKESSELEVSYLNELAALQRLKAAYDARKVHDDDD
jgi:hypothetical protein